MEEEHARTQVFVLTDATGDAANQLVSVNIFEALGIDVICHNVHFK